MKPSRKAKGSLGVREPLAVLSLRRELHSRECNLKWDGSDASIAESSNNRIVAKRHDGSTVVLHCGKQRHRYVVKHGMPNNVITPSSILDVQIKAVTIW